MNLPVGSKALILVWGTEDEHGEHFFEVLAGRHSSAVGLKPSEGAGPLMDCVLSRRAQSGVAE